MKSKVLLIFFILTTLAGCYAGSVKPMLDRPEFKAENEPIRTLRILLVTDNTFRKDDIDRFISSCSRLTERQVGIRLEIVDWYEITWADELKDIFQMVRRVAGDTWNRREDFDVTIAPVYFSHIIDVGKGRLGSIDTFFWRYIFVKELDPSVLLHEVFHGFLMQERHSSEDWVMKAERSPYGNEWYWLTPSEREEILRNKWRDFNVMSSAGNGEERKSKAAWFYYSLGSFFLQKKDFDQALRLFDQSLEIDPKNAQAFNVRGLTYGYKRQTDLAVADYNKATELNPRYAPAYYNRAVLYETQREFARAISDLNKALQIDPNYVSAHNDLAWLHATARSPAFRDGRKALVHALKACDLTHRDNPAYLDTLAAAYARAGDFDSAIQWQKRVLEYPEFSSNQDAQARFRLYRDHKPYPPD